jgi:hypothetical protein
MFDAPEELVGYNQLLFHPAFNETIKEIEKLNIRLPHNPIDISVNYDTPIYNDGDIVIQIEDKNKYKLNAYNGQRRLSQYSSICSYDESIHKFMGLEGSAYITSHSLILMGKDDHIPKNLLTFYFYTRSKILLENTKYIKKSKDPDSDSKKDYNRDRKNFLSNNVPNNSILFIDGPMIGKQMTYDTLKLVEELNDKNINSIFFVKNSSGNLVTDYIDTLKDRFNSDMHWAYYYLKPGERSCLYKYQNKKFKKWIKIFCYIKTFDVSPQRIEMDINTYGSISKNIDELFDIIFYLALAQGDLKNPQIRPIAIAEKYARETLNLINLYDLLKYIGMTPTMNEKRGFR